MQMKCKRSEKSEVFHQLLRFICIMIFIRLPASLNGSDGDWRRRRKRKSHSEWLNHNTAQFLIKNLYNSFQIEKMTQMCDIIIWYKVKWNLGIYFKRKEKVYLDDFSLRHVTRSQNLVQFQEKEKKRKVVLNEFKLSFDRPRVVNSSRWKIVYFISNLSHF